MSVTLCIDLGGTNLRAGVIAEDPAAEPQPVGHWPAPESLGALRDRIHGLVSAHGASRIGVAVPGLATGSRCVWVPNLPYLDGVDLASAFPDARLALGNDAQLALLAEAAHGAAQTVSNAILLAIGTGIGSAVLADGRIVRGANGAATSFGWANADMRDGGDDKHGWLERQASGRALDALAGRAQLKKGADLIAAAADGQADAKAILAGTANALAATLAGAVALLGSEAVIVSGGVAEGIGVLTPMILPALRRQLPPHLRAIEIVTGRFGPRASLYGAGLAACEHALWTGRGTS
jgi:glucokinase